MNTSRFVGTTVAATLLGVSVSWLRAQKAAFLFNPGEHWIYATGRPGSRVLWNIDAIHQWQADQTRLVVEQTPLRAAAIETYTEVTNG